MTTRYYWIAVWLALAAPLAAQDTGHPGHHSPYADQTGSGIAALSLKEAQGLSEGAGMGLARAAELNHYPGPLHALELAEEIELSSGQRTDIEAFRAQMLAAAKRLGAQILEKERHLDRRFARQHIDEPALRTLTDEIARLMGELRFVHLLAHLQTRAALTPSQIEAYDRLRGYHDSATSATPAHQRPAATPCAPIKGLAPLLEKRTVLLLGEIHGSRESPAFVAEVVCQALASGLSVTVALELLDRDAGGIEAFLSSSATVADRDRLTANGVWISPYQDGRSSRAMVDLLDRLRGFRTSSDAVAVELFDRGGWRSGQQRDRLMANALAESLARTESDFVVVVTGNIHSRVVQGTPWDAGYQPMGQLLAALTDWRLVSLDVAHMGGSAWMCSGNDPASCGVRQFRDNGGRAGPAIELGADPISTGHNGRYHVGALSASPPAAGGHR